MYHCVFSYSRRILLDKNDESSISIWRLTLKDRPFLTICISTASLEISEVRGLYNRLAKQVGLGISGELFS